MHQIRGNNINISFTNFFLSYTIFITDSKSFKIFWQIFLQVTEHHSFLLLMINIALISCTLYVHFYIPPLYKENSVYKNKSITICKQVINDEFGTLYSLRTVRRRRTGWRTGTQVPAYRAQCNVFNVTAGGCHLKNYFITLCLFISLKYFTRRTRNNHANKK